MDNRALRNLAIDITHHCNLNCDFCGKMIWDSDYQLSLEDLDLFCTYCADTPAEFIRISGGEALTHPHIRDIIWTLLDRIGKPLELATNGLLLPDFEDLIPLFKVIHISPYKRKNMAMVERYRSLPNVNIVELPGWFNINHDPDYSLEVAYKVYQRCHAPQINVIGDRVYGCCNAETIEREYDIPIVHAKLGPGWQQEFASVSCLPACQHCFLAASHHWED